MAKDEDRKKKKRKNVAEPEPASGSKEEQAEDGVIASLDTTEVADSKPASEEFESWYLRKVTMELQDDLNKIRSAGDFKDSSLPILITALKQGESIFSTDEKTRIMTGDA